MKISQGNLERTFRKLVSEKSRLKPAGIKAALRKRMLNALEPTSLGLTVLYLVFSISHLLVLPRPLGITMSLVAVISSVILFLFYFALKYNKVKPALGHPLSALIIGIVLLNCLLHLYLFPKPIQTTNLLLLIVGMGFLLHSHFWYAAGMLANWLGWMIAVLIINPGADWTHYGFAMFSASMLSVIVHIAKYESTKKLETLKLDLEGQVLERTRELQLQVRELQALHEIGKIANKVQIEDELIARFVNCLRNDLFSEQLQVYLYDSGRETLTLHASCRDEDCSHGEVETPPRMGVIEETADTGLPRLIPDLKVYGGDSNGNNGIKSSLCVPILGGEGTLGVIRVNSLELEGFSPSDQRLLMTLSSQVASALDRVRWAENNQTLIQQLKSLHHIDKVINSSTELPPILRVFLGEIKDHLGVGASSILLYNKKMDCLDYIAGRGFETVSEPALRLSLEENPLKQVVQERSMISLPDLEEGHFTEERLKFFRQEGFHSYLVIPMLARSEVKGVLELFFRKPFQPSPGWLEILKTYTDQASLAVDSMLVFSDLQQANIDLHLTYNKTIEGWAKALELRDRETEGHCRRVAEMAGKLGWELGLNDKELVQLNWGALLHDIGKLGIPDSILHKPGPLNAQERETIERHPLLGYQLLSEIEYLQGAIDIPYYHHEKWDGTGYPQGLAGEDIPLKARIFAVVDVYDALRSERSYRDTWSEDKAKEYIRKQSGIHFDPGVVEVFFNVMERDHFQAPSVH